MSHAKAAAARAQLVKTVDSISKMLDAHKALPPGAFPELDAEIPHIERDLATLVSSIQKLEHNVPGFAPIH